ncbi:MAG: hypothetical protein ACXWQO_14850 [Bdellovibrionota bacterium]
MKILLVAISLIVATASAHAENFWANSSDRFEVRAAAVPPGITLQKLITFSNDRDAIVNRMSVMIDSKNLVAGVYMDENTNVSIRSFGPGSGAAFLRDIESSEGGVLFEGQGHKVVLMQGKLNRETQEGRFQMRYLANGLTNNYEACDVLLKKDDKGWFLQNAYTNKKITAAKLITWSLGLSTLQGICPPKTL